MRNERIIGMLKAVNKSFFRLGDMKSLLGRARDLGYGDVADWIDKNQATFLALLENWGSAAPTDGMDDNEGQDEKEEQGV